MKMDDLTEIEKMDLAKKKLKEIVDK